MRLLFIAISIFIQFTRFKRRRNSHNFILRHGNHSLRNEFMKDDHRSFVVSGKKKNENVKTADIKKTEKAGLRFNAKLLKLGFLRSDDEQMFCGIKEISKIINNENLLKNYLSRFASSSLSQISLHLSLSPKYPSYWKFPHLCHALELSHSRWTNSRIIFVISVSTWVSLTSVWRHPCFELKDVKSHGRNALNRTCNCKD